MILLHGFVFVQSWANVAIGMPDFTIFYSAGHILRSGQASNLYDDNLQQRMQTSLNPAGVRKRGSILPYNHPAFEAVLFAPLASFSYLTAYRVWLLTNLTLLMGIPFLLRKQLPILGTAPLGFWFLGMFAYFPIFMALLQGQDSILLLFTYCCAYAALYEKKQLRMGGWLGFGLFKFHLILPFISSMVWLWSRKLLTGFIAVAASAIAVGIWVCGIRGTLRYPHFIWAAEHNKSYMWNGGFYNTANLHGLIGVFLPMSQYWLFRYILVVSSVLVLVAASMVWRKTNSAGQPDGPLAFAVALIATVLVSYHIFVYDWSILLLAIVLLVESLLSRDSLIQKVRTPVCMCLATLFFSPIYMVLILRYQRMELMASVLLFLFLTLLVGVARSGKLI